MKQYKILLFISMSIIAACRQEPRPTVEIPTLETRPIDTVTSIHKKVDTLSSKIKTIKTLEQKKIELPIKKPVSPPPTQPSKELKKDTTIQSKPVKKNKIMVNQNDDH